MPRRYDPSQHHDPLFADPGQGGVQTGSTEQASKRARTIRSVAFGLCPGHTDDGSGKRTGLVRQGPHLVWRWHQTKTFGGAHIECASSGQPVCTSPSRPGHTVTCSCGGPP